MKLKKPILLTTTIMLFSFSLFLIFTATTFGDNLLTPNQKNIEIDSKATSEINEVNETKEISGNLKEVHMSAFFNKAYNSIEELLSSSDIVIEGEVINAKSFNRNETTYTKSVIEVKKSYNDKIQVGSKVTIVEIGGITTKGEISKNTKGKVKVKEEDLNTPVQVIFNNMPVMSKKEKVLVFGISPETKDLLEEEYYFPLGAYQGKFNINGNKVKRKVPKGEEKSYKSLEFLHENTDKLLDRR